MFFQPSHTLKLIASLFILFLTTQIQAKTVVCIDDNGNANDGYLNGMEGWYRQQAQPGDVIVKGGTLTDCLANLADGDCLVIVCHGSNKGQGFRWGGSYYTGFGDGDNEMNVPDGLDEKVVKIKFQACWSDRDPDGPGDDNPDTPLTDKLKAKCKTGSTADGFSDEAEPRVCVRWVNGTRAMCKTVNDSLLKNDSWLDKPPHNRPNAPVPNDKSCIEAIANHFQNGLQVNVIYYAPVNVVAEDDEEVSIETPGELVIGCDCDESCGFYRAMFDDIYYPPVIESASNFPMPGGLWRMDEMLMIPIPPQGEIFIRNIRWLDFGTLDLPDGSTGPVSFVVNMTAQAQTSEDGQYWLEDLVPGFIQGMAIPNPNPTAHNYYDIEVTEMHLDFLSNPILPFFLVSNPGQPGTGLTGVQAQPDGSFIVDSFFDISYDVVLADGMALGPVCGQPKFYLACPNGGPGCSDMDAPNFDLCAMNDDGSCQGNLAGCTYPGASNYNPNATTENGTCIFHGCTDPTANNHDPLANTDNGSCDFSIACPTDLDHNGTTNTSDLLGFLEAFGQPCM